MAEVVLRGVAHRYPGATDDTLAGLSLEVGAGEAHALLGSSGAGKTTLLNVLSGLAQPSAGEVVFDGRAVTALGPRERNVTQVFQFPVLYESLTVAGNLEFPLRTRGVPRAERRARAAELAEQLGIGALLERKPARLSLFEKQLVAIGRALAPPETAVVLLDEPLTAVEPARKWQLRRVLKQAQAELAATMIYVTHDQTEALTFADRISVMHNGTILQTGSPSTLFEAPDHEHVAHFIGSPGMNLIPGALRDGSVWLGGAAVAVAPAAPDGDCVVGFRPEWAHLEPGDDGLQARVDSVRVLGVDHDQPVGLVHAVLLGRSVNVRQALTVRPGSTARLALDPGRVLVFRGGRRLG